MQKVKIRFAYKAGLRRIWLVLSALWVAFSTWLFFMSGNEFDGRVASLIVGPPIVLYVLILLATWVVEGFAKADR